MMLTNVVSFHQISRQEAERPAADTNHIQTRYCKELWFTLS